MTDQEPPSLSKYFGTEDPEKDAIDFSKQIAQATEQLNSIKLDQSNKAEKEPEVCKLFTKTTVEAKDPTASFFNFIGYPNEVRTFLIKEENLV